MNIAIVSHLYPNRDFPASGTFIRSYHMGLRKLFQTQMIVPTVRAIPFTHKWKYTHSPFLINGEARRLRYLSFPGMRGSGMTRRTLSQTLIRYLQTVPVDLVHLHWLYPDGLAVPMIKKLSLPVVLSIHGSDWYNTRHDSTLRDLLYESLTAADAVFTVGKKLKMDIVHTYPELENRTHVTYNPVDFHRFQPPVSREKALEQFQWDPGKVHLLCVANITHEKGIDILLDATRQFDKRTTHIHFIGNVPDSAYAREIRSKISRQENTFLHLPVSHERIAAYYQACDLLILPSRREGFGLSAAEAIACGKPVIATRCGGPEDIITSENGFLVDKESPDQIADKVDFVISGKSGLHDKKIRESLREKFDSETIIRDIGAFFEDIHRTSKPGQTH